MALSVAEQQEIQRLIDGATKEQRDEIRRTAVQDLRELSKYGTLGGGSTEDIDLNAELLTRLDATELGKGGFYRMRRRFQILNTYFK
jgi:hypothetical protein